MGISKVNKLIEKLAGRGQCTYEEYEVVYDYVVDRAPCNLLVWGLGKDSALWIDSNEGGDTTFIEHEGEWIKKTKEEIPGIDVVQVSYDTKRSKWRDYLSEDGKKRESPDLLIDLPDSICNTEWEITFVDSPQGGNPDRPGRMASICTASHLTSNCYFIHDCNRKVESTYSRLYLGEPSKGVNRMWCYFNKL